MNMVAEKITPANANANANADTNAVETSASSEAEGSPFRTLARCLACGSESCLPYLDLGTQPLANNFHDGSSPQERFPLAVQLCCSCFHSQLTVAVKPDLLYRHYVYVSGTTRTLADYFARFADDVTKRYGERRLEVLDIASNDGSLLACFKDLGHGVQGVDPARNLYAMSQARGIPTEIGYWDADMAARLGRRFDVIIAMNVLGHVANPAEFLSACRRALRPGGVVFIQTSQADIFKNGEFDTIYHEHLSFFTMRSFSRLAERGGLSVVDAQVVPVHGNSYLWALSADDMEAQDSVIALERQEAESGYYQWCTYQQFAHRAREIAGEVAHCVDDLRAQGWIVAGYGAAAKGNTFLNFSGVKLDFVVDDNPLKHGLRTPGGNVPVVGPQALETIDTPIALLVLAWNFFDEVVARVKARRPGRADRFIRYFPALSICVDE